MRIHSTRNLLRAASGVVFAVYLFSGCGGSTDSGKSQQKVFHYAHASEPKRLDPAYMYDRYEGIVSGLLFDGLVVFDSRTDIRPGLAERWDISADGRTYTFHLRDARFSDGRPVTAADVRYSFTRILRPETNSERKWLFDELAGAEEVAKGVAKEVSGIDTPDTRTVRITLKSAYPPFLTKLAMPNAVIIPEGSAGNDKPDPAFDSRPVGTGPWVLDKFLRDQRLEFRRNGHFWGDAPRMDRFVFHIIMNTQVQDQLFQVGNLDVYNVAFTVFADFLRDPAKKARMMPVQELNTYFFAFMNNKPKFADKRAKQAIAHGINSKSIFENLQKGRGEQAHGPVPPGIAGYRPGIKPREYDPKLAKHLLSEAGATGMKIDLWFSDDNQTGEFASAVKSDLAKIGVGVNLIRRDLASVRQAIYNGEPDMYFYSWWLDYPDIENALVPCFASRNIPRAGNGSHFSNLDFDRLVAEAGAEGDPNRRIELFQAAEDIIIDECPWIFLYHQKSYYMVQPWVRNYAPPQMPNSERCEGVDIDLARKARGL